MADNALIRKVLTEDVEFGEGQVTFTDQNGISRIGNKINDDTIPVKSGLFNQINTVHSALTSLKATREFLSDYANLADAVTKIGANETTLVIDKSETLSADVTIPENIDVLFVKGNVIDGNGTATLTINGGIQAGLYQIFGDNLILEGTPKIVSFQTEWVGAGTINNIILEKPNYEVLGVIRNDGTGWKFIDYGNHKPEGFTGISSTDNEIYLYWKDSKDVGTFLVVPDETLSGYDIVAGASVALNHCRIEIWKRASFVVKLDDATFNLVDDIDKEHFQLIKQSDGSVLINHPSVRGALSVTHAGTSVKHRLTVSVSLTSHTIKGFSIFEGYIYYDGVDWRVSSNLVSPLSLSFDDTNGRLTVTHAESSGVGYDINISRQSNGYEPRLYSSNKSSFVIEFYNNGNKITTPDTNMKFFFTRPNTLLGVPEVSGYAVVTGFYKVNPNKLVSSSGNFWLYGKFYRSK